MTGHVRLPAASHCSMLDRSYVWPVDRVTGSVNKSRLIGHLNKWGIIISASFIEENPSFPADSKKLVGIVQTENPRNGC